MIWHVFEVWLLMLAAFVVGAPIGAIAYDLIARTALAGAQERMADAIGSVVDNIKGRLGIGPVWRPERQRLEEEPGAPRVPFTPWRRDDTLDEDDIEVVDSDAEPFNDGIEPMRPMTLPAPRNEVADDLQRIYGVGARNEKRLNALGIFHYGQIAAWTPAEMRWIALRMAFPERVEADDWVGQAIALATGGDTGYAKAGRRTVRSGYDDEEDDEGILMLPDAAIGFAIGSDSERLAAAVENLAERRAEEEADEASRAVANDGIAEPAFDDALAEEDEPLTADTTDAASDAAGPESLADTPDEADTAPEGVALAASEDDATPVADDEASAGASDVADEDDDSPSATDDEADEVVVAALDEDDVPQALAAEVQGPVQPPRRDAGAKGPKSASLGGLSLPDASLGFMVAPTTETDVEPANLDEGDDSERVKLAADLPADVPVEPSPAAPNDSPISPHNADEVPSVDQDASAKSEDSEPEAEAPAADDAKAANPDDETSETESGETPAETDDGKEGSTDDADRKNVDAT